MQDASANPNGSEDTTTSPVLTMDSIAQLYALYQQPELIPLGRHPTSFLEGEFPLEQLLNVKVSEQALDKSMAQISRFQKDTKLFGDIYDILEKENRSDSDLDKLNFFFGKVFPIEEYPIKDPFFLQPIYSEIAENGPYDVFGIIMDHIKEMVGDDRFRSLISMRCVKDNTEYDAESKDPVEYKENSYLYFLVSMCEELNKDDPRKMNADDVSLYLNAVKESLTKLYSAGIPVNMLFSRRESDEDDTRYNFVDELLTKVVEDFDREKVAEGYGIKDAMSAITTLLITVYRVGGPEALGNPDIYEEFLGGETNPYSPKFIDPVKVLGRYVDKPVFISPVD